MAVMASEADEPELRSKLSQDLHRDPYESSRAAHSDKVARANADNARAYRREAISGLAVASWER
jgi:hypothetical protein